MPLVLTMKEGEDFYVRDDRFVLSRVTSSTKFHVTRERDQKLFEITDARATEIADDVMASCGDRPQPYLARVAFNAPRSIPINRGDAYREEHARV